MPKRKSFRVLVATDGSAAAKAAVSTAASFPWPEDVHFSGVLADETFANLGAPLAAPDDSVQRVADNAIRL